VRGNRWINSARTGLPSKNAFPPRLIPLKTAMRPALLFSLLAIPHAFSALPPAEQASAHVSEIAAVFPSNGWKELRVTPPRLVSQAPGQLYENGLPPVWVAGLEDAQGGSGYLMWEEGESGALLEFALDADSEAVPKGGGLTSGVPALQQFPVSGRNSEKVASGCVPTAGASLLGYWTTHGFPDWAGTAPQAPDARLKDFALRLRKLLRMAEMPDTSGYTDDGMTLSGAYPKELAAALEKDAEQNALPLKTEFARFSFERLKHETAAARPVLLSCMVRLPQKPHLSWGHEVIGVGWLEMRGNQYVGVKDNFYAVQSGQTVRWIRKEAFDSLIRVRPSRAGEAGASW